MLLTAGEGLEKQRNRLVVVAQEVLDITVASLQGGVVSRKADDGMKKRLVREGTLDQNIVNEVVGVVPEEVMVICDVSE